MKSLLHKILWLTIVCILYTTNQPALAVPPDQQGQLNTIQAYLNNIYTLQADFVQDSPDGTTSTGKVYLKRLGKGNYGKLRLNYNPPNNTRIIADGEILRYEDGQTKEVSEYFIESTPASFLLRHKIDLANDLEVQKMETRANKVYLTINRPGDEGVTLTLVFQASPLLLKEWTTVDAAANKTHIKLGDVDTSTPIDDRLFRF